MFLWIYHSFSCDFPSLNSFRWQLLYGHDYKSSFLVWLQQQSGDHSNVFCLWTISVGNKGLVIISLNSEKGRKNDRSLFITLSWRSYNSSRNSKKNAISFLRATVAFLHSHYSKNLNVMITFLLQYNICYYHLQVLGKLQFYMIMNIFCYVFCWFHKLKSKHHS